MRTESDRAVPGIVTGTQYNAQITARESDRRARAAFRDLVLHTARPGATLLDFGAGTGMDARFYAEHGFTVWAYDADPRMCEFFRSHCRELMHSGRVRLQEGSYRDFLAVQSPGGCAAVDLVTSNFAPLNLIDNLRELFAAFHAITAPHALVLASVISPYFFGDLRYGWWWRNLPWLVRDGRYAVPGAQALIWRRRRADFVSACGPWFRLEAVFAGNQPPQSAGARTAWLRLSTCRFMFLLFRKCPIGA